MDHSRSLRFEVRVELAQVVVREPDLLEWLDPAAAAGTWWERLARRTRYAWCSIFLAAPGVDPRIRRSCSRTGTSRRAGERSWSIATSGPCTCRARCSGSCIGS